jgi:hypothetical protein
LSANTAGALLRWKEVKLGANAVEVQAEERNGLLFEASDGRGLGGVSRDHAEVIGEDGGRPKRIEVVGDRATTHELEGAVRILEVQLREPVHGLVLFDTRGGTLRFTEVIRRRNLDSEVRTADDSVNVASDSAGGHDGVSTFNGENVLCGKWLN